MASEQSVAEHRSQRNSLALASVDSAEKNTDLSRQVQGNGAPVVQDRDGDTASLLSAASPPAAGAARLGSPRRPTVTASYPTITTTTTSTTTTVTSTTTTASQQRVMLFAYDVQAPWPAWDHYTACAHSIHSTLHNNTCGAQLVRQILRIPCTTNFYPADESFIDEFIEVVKKTLVSKEDVKGLSEERASWFSHQTRASPVKQEELSVWITIFDCALMLAEALHWENDQGTGGKVDKLRKLIDEARKKLVRIHLGDKIYDDPSWSGHAGNASSVPKADSAQRPRAASMTVSATPASPGRAKKAPPQLPEENSSDFSSKQEALLSWKKKANKKFEKHHVDLSLLRFLERSLEAIIKDRPYLPLIAYKFVASVVFAEWTRPMSIADAVVETTESELGYVNEILSLCEKLKAVVRHDSAASEEDKRYSQAWLSFFHHVGVLMKFRRDNRETPLRTSFDTTQPLVDCENAYDALLKAKREADDLLRRQDRKAHATEKSDRAKERRLKSFSMDFQRPGKEKKAAQPSVARDTDAISSIRRDDIINPAKTREKTADDGLSVKAKARTAKAIRQDQGGIPRTSRQAEDSPDHSHSPTTGPTSPRAASKPVKKINLSEATQQEAGPIRAGEKKKSKAKTTQQQDQTNAEVRETRNPATPRESGKEKKERKEKRVEKAEKAENKDTASKRKKDD